MIATADVRWKLMNVAFAAEKGRGRIDQSALRKNLGKTTIAMMAITTALAVGTVAIAAVIILKRITFARSVNAWIRYTWTSRKKSAGENA